MRAHGARRLVELHHVAKHIAPEPGAGGEHDDVSHARLHLIARERPGVALFVLIEGDELEEDPPIRVEPERRLARDVLRRDPPLARRVHLDAEGDVAPRAGGSAAPRLADARVEGGVFHPAVDEQPEVGPEVAEARRGAA